MSSKRLRGAKALIDEMGANLPKIEKQVNEAKGKQQAAPEDTLGAVELDRLAKEKLSTTVSLSTKLAIAKIQEDAISRGWKKPKIGEILDESVQMLLKERGLLNK